MRAPDLGPARWLTSSYSSANANCVQVAAVPARWLTSTYSTANADCVQVAAVPARWLTSSYSSSNANCVQVGAASAGIAVRDSKDPDGPALLTPHWGSFVVALRARAWSAGS